MAQPPRSGGLLEVFEKDSRKFLNSTTQMLDSEGVIQLWQGTVYIAGGEHSHWLSFLQHFTQADGDHFQYRVCETLEGIWSPEDQSVLIQDPSAMNENLTIYRRDFQHLESLISELHQG